MEVDYLDSLQCNTPADGRILAFTLARKTIAAIQTDPKIRKELRPQYATDTAQLIASSQVVAIEFQTIAMANNYWKDEN